MDYSFSLNKDQQDCVNHFEGPMLVLAGAGSGKTRVVTYRIAKLIEMGVPPSEILAVTFTNKAAGEMRSRVQGLTEQYILTSTFHSLGAKILRESIHHLGYNNDFTIFDSSDSEELIKSGIKEFGVEAEKSLVKSFKTSISNAKNELLEPEDIQASSKDQAPMLYSIYRYYQEHLRKNQAVDFDDLLYLTVKLFKKHPDVLQHYQDRWSFYLVDEYQDINKAQYLMIKTLCSKHCNLFVVGDPDQSIYSWRGANIANILNFEHDFPNAKVKMLNQNYRSTATILNAANAVIANNVNRYEKDLFSQIENGEEIKLCIAQTDREEAEWILKNIRQYRRNFSYKDMVIFYRTNSQSRLYEDCLIREGIPYQIIGGISFYQRKEIKDILAWLKMIASPYDMLSFNRCLSTPKRGIGKTTLTNLLQYLSEQPQPLYEALESMLDSQPSPIRLTKKQKSSLMDFMEIRHELVSHKELPIHQLISLILEKTGYENHLKNDPETYQDRKSNLEELLSKAVEFESENTTPSLQQFLEEFTLKVANDDSEESDDSLKLMTFHTSKGLEFEVVFMVGMEEDLFPHINSKESSDQLEEERRLCYVGMTRAKKQLFLSCSKYRMLWGNPRMMRPSRFLSEVPDQFIKTTSFGSQAADIHEEGIQAGEAVYHRSFGKGIVKKAYQTSLGLTYDVYFPSSESIKTLVAKYAKLSLL